jgi:hypothetical protein
MISTRYDHKPEHLRFQRQHTGRAPDRTPPIVSWGIEILRAAVIVLFIGGLIALAAVLA